MKKAVLLVGFGGPASPAEVRPFLESVLEGIRIPQARFESVLHHYDLVGGVSPYNAVVNAQAGALKAHLFATGTPFPVRAGYRHSSPSFKDVFSEHAAAGVTDVAGFVLSALRSYSSFQKYQERVEKGRLEAGASTRVHYTAPFHNDPLFIRAHAERVLEALAALPGRRPFVLFSAHSIPVPAAKESGYDRQFEEIASLVGAHLAGVPWGIAYQSRSGRPEDPWLVPDVCETVRGIDRERFDTVLLVPAGFLCENVEILYDLDIEVRAAAEEKGFLYARAETVFDHPAFLELMARQVREILEPV